MMVVVAIMGLMVGGLMIGAGSLEREKLVSSTMEIASAFRFAYSQSAITGKGIRIVIDLNNNSFSLEEAEPGRVLLTKEGEESEEEEEQEAQDSLQMDDIGEELKKGGVDLDLVMQSAQQAAFQKADKDENVDMNLVNQLTDSSGQGINLEDVPRYKRPRFQPMKGKAGQSHKLEDGIEFEKVYTTHNITPIEEGKAFIYFFPGGEAEHCVVQIRTSEGIIHSVEVFPLTGEVKIEDIPIELEDSYEEENE